MLVLFAFRVYLALLLVGVSTVSQGWHTTLSERLLASARLATLRLLGGVVEDLLELLRPALELLPESEEGVDLAPLGLSLSVLFLDVLQL